MDQVIEFFSNLFETTDWPPRWYCGTWTSFHGWLYIISDIAIWLAYFIIPVIIVWFIQKKHDVPFLPVFWLFGAFIILCGFTHLLDALIFWWPGYRLSALVRAITAVISFITVLALIRDLPKALDLKPQGKGSNNQEDELQRKLNERDNKIAELRKEIINLKKRL